ncbi:hypothetical protein [Cryptosporangium japonicum]|uniref:hypothetical protein n=1 Tax=Cryptosporangium japonicum TaxID=80872 RepID=UPI0031D016CA
MATETWWFGDGTRVETGDIQKSLNGLIARGETEIRLTASSGRELGLITNGVRARVTRREQAGFPDEVAYERQTRGADRVVLIRADGVGNEYSIEDTIALPEALRLIGHVVTTGDWNPPYDSDIFWPDRAVRLMGDYMTDDPVWDSDGPIRLERLGISQPLVQRLRDWNTEFSRLPLTNFEFPTPEDAERWRSEGRQLAYQLQDELPNIEVSYWHDGDYRPVREHRGG